MVEPQDEQGLAGHADHHLREPRPAGCLEDPQADETGPGHDRRDGALTTLH